MEKRNEFLISNFSSESMIKTIDDVKSKKIVGIFTPTMSLEQEFDYLEKLREQKQEYCDLITSQGFSLIDFAESGDLSSIDTIIKGSIKEEVLMYFAIKMFELACLNMRIPIIKYMFINGIDLSFGPLKHIGFKLIPYLSEKQLLLLFPLLKQCGYNLTLADPDKYQTLLHVACQYPYSDLVLFLIQNKDGLLPYNYTESLVKSDPWYLLNYHSDESYKVLKILQENGARSTWRSNPVVINNISSSSI